jgi:hypothetical protein
MSEQSDSVAYDDGDYNKLMSELQTISTFAQVKVWDERAQAELLRIIQVIQELDSAIVWQSLASKERQTIHAEKSFLSRALSSKKDEDEIDALIRKYKGYKETLQSMAKRLQESIDFTPNSAEEQQPLVNELRQRKKELQSSRRQVIADMQAIRTEARQESAQVGTTWLGFYNPELAARKRRQIRYQKEAALQPHEDEKAAIDRQLIQIEKDIQWAQRFTT